MKIKIEIHPLSVNKTWQGKRFKTKEYKEYEKYLLFVLPKIKLPEKPFKIFYEFGFSNILSDLDNPIKPLTDILQKKYGFNDKDIYEAHIYKKIVPKGKEYLSFLIESL